jgi:hypothetical protein
MAPIQPATLLQGSLSGDFSTSTIRPFGLLFPSATLTVKNETALMRVRHFQHVLLSI